MAENERERTPCNSEKRPPKIIGWLNIGNGVRSALVQDAENARNYRIVRVYPGPDGFLVTINRERRGFYPSMDEAKSAAVDMARADLVA